MFTRVPTLKAGPFFEAGWKLQPWGLGVWHWASFVGSERPLERGAGEMVDAAATAVLISFLVHALLPSPGVWYRLPRPSHLPRWVPLLHCSRSSSPRPFASHSVHLPLTCCHLHCCLGFCSPVPYHLGFCLSPMLGFPSPPRGTRTVHPSRHCLVPWLPCRCQSCPREMEVLAHTTFPPIFFVTA